LYGDCLPTIATAGAADSFRAEQLVFSPVLFMLAHPRRSEQRPEGRPPRKDRDSRHIDVIAIVKVT
jgi:hypothetical protein